MSKAEAIEEVRRVLSRMNRASKRDVRFPWINNRVPVGTRVPAPPRIQYRLAGVHARLGGDWERLKEKRAVPLTFDFQLDDMTLIEVDDGQHFSVGRLETLEFYDGLEHSLDIDKYRDLCERFALPADRYRRSRTREFPEGGRAAQTAYFDIAKDLLSVANGYQLIRLPAADNYLITEMEFILRVRL